MAEAQSPWAIDVTDETFEQAVIEQSHERPVVVDFWAEWCQPCRLLGPVLERLAAERAGAFVLAKVNVDEAQDLAAAFRIEGIPAVKAFRDGRPVLEFTGLLPEEHLRDFINRIVPTEAERAAGAAALLEAKDPGQAETQYRQLLAQDPNQTKAVVGLARLLLARGADAEADEFLSRVDLVGDEADEAERLRAVLDLHKHRETAADETALRQQAKAEPADAQALYELGRFLAAEDRYPEALATLLRAAEADRKLGANQVRELMVQIFKVVGVRSPLADEYRDKLAKLLY